MGVLSGLEPERVFYYFEEISKIPHGSGNTKRISDYIVSFAAEHGLEYLQDHAGNVIISKAASPGKEGSDPVMLQGHMDMVAAKTADAAADMEKDGLKLLVKDGRISADKTSLGGDDGIAVAYMLTLLESDALVHPPLECVFTVDEEIGMLGASALDMSVLKARRLINLDSETEGVLCVSCAGGVSVTTHLQVVEKPAFPQGVLVRISGCMGGHSGQEIDKGRANAIRELGRFLYALRTHTPFRIARVQGGTQDNAIPSSAEAVLTFPEEENASVVMEQARLAQEVFRKEYALTDPEISVTCETTQTGGTAFGTHTTNRVIAAMRGLPNGVQRMSPQAGGPVQTSVNLGFVETSFGEVNLHFCVRSSVASEKTEVVERIKCLTEFLGGYTTLAGDYPGMPYLEDSPLRDTMVDVFRQQYGKEPVVEAIHAGLECGLFAGGIEGLDYVSIGPDMEGIHSVSETLDIASTQRTWKYLTAVLERL